MFVWIKCELRRQEAVAKGIAGQNASLGSVANTVERGRSLSIRRIGSASPSSHQHNSTPARPHTLASQQHAGEV